MRKKNYRVVIPPTAKESLRDIVEYIRKDSATAAIKVRKKLLAIAKSLNTQPERFSKEEYLSMMHGNYRSVTQWHYKIVYKVLIDEVIILRFMHTKQDPEVIKKLK